MTKIFAIFFAILLFLLSILISKVFFVSSITIPVLFNQLGSLHWLTFTGNPINSSRANVFLFMILPLGNFWLFQFWSISFFYDTSTMKPMSSRVSFTLVR